MSKKEVFFVLSVTIISYALLFIIKSRIPNIVLNLVLISFYTMFLLGRLPLSCYPNENKNIGKEEYVTIGASLFFLICCLLACLFPASIFLSKSKVGLFSLHVPIIQNGNY